MEEFVAVFRRFCDQSSLFIVTKTPKPLGSESRFNITLGDGTPMLGGAGRVVESHSDSNNSFGRPGMRIRFAELDDQSREVLERLNQARAITSPTPVPLPKHMRRAPTAQPIPPRSPDLSAKPVIKIPDIPGPGASKASSNASKASSNADTADPGKSAAGKAALAAEAAAAAEAASAATAAVSNTDEATTVDAAPGEQREKGSDFVLPANPFGALTDASLEAFVECTLYEETGNVFIGDLDADAGKAEPEPSKDSGNGKSKDKDVPAWWPSEEAAVGATPASAAAPAARPDPTPAPGAAPLWTGAADSAPVQPQPQPPSEGLMLPAAGASVRKSPMSRMMIAIAIALPLGLLIGFVIWGTGDDDQSPAKKPEAKATVPAKATIDANDEVAKLPSSTDAGVRLAPVDGGSAVAIVSDAAVAAVDPPATDGLEPIPPALDPGPEDCAISVVVNKDEASVYADNSRVGMAPFAGVVPCATTSISIRRARYEKLVQAVELTPGETTELNLRLVRPNFKIQVSSSPTGASVSIGGRNVGQTPLTTSIRGYDKTTIKISKKGYKTYTKRIYPKSKSIGIRTTLRKLRRGK